MKKKATKLLLTICLVFASTFFAACDSLLGCLGGGSLFGKQIPVYQGMTITSAQTTSATSLKTSLTSTNSGLVLLGEENGNKDNNGNHNGWHKGDYVGKDENIDEENPFPDNSENENIESEIQDSLEVIGSGKTIYYAESNQDIYINIYISNPDSFEILSFTLNGTKYSSYMFEAGSDMQNIILKYNVGWETGIKEYTIDAIKYVDGTEIKDVKIGGDKTVRAGVRRENQVNANVSNVQIGFNDISFTATVSDEDKLIEYSAGELKAVLYDGEKLVGTQDLVVGENEVSFDGLKTNGLYQYAIVGYYDNLEYGFGMNVLEKQAFYTNAIVLFDNIVVGQDGVSFAYNWSEDFKNQTISSLKVYKDGELIKTLSSSATSVDGLISDEEYKIIAEYKNGANTESIYLEFVTILDSNKISTDENGCTLYTDGSIVKLIEYVGSKPNLVLPEQVTEIQRGALKDNKIIVSVMIGGKVKKIKESAFSGCTNLLNVYYKGDSTAWGKVEIEEYNVPLFSATVNYYSVNEPPMSSDGNGYDGNYWHYVNGKIKAWWTMKATEGVLYDISADGNSADVIGYEGTATNVVIADTYQGLPVTNIYKKAFYQNKSITGLVIPDSVTLIGDYAFENCDNLTSVVIGDSVTSIGEGAFYNCSALTSVVIGDSVTSIGNHVFSGCSSLTSVVIGDSVTSIGYAAFSNCTSLTSVVIGDSVTSIGNYAFSGCRSLTSVVIGDSVTSIGYAAFANCNNLQFNEYGNCKYLGNEENPYLALIQATNQNYSSYTVHENTKVIADKAFYECVRMSSIAIPDSVTSIGYAAFSDCSSLTSVTFENTEGWWYASSSTATSGTSISSTDLANPATAAKYLKSTYLYGYWKRSEE